MLVEFQWHDSQLSRCQPSLVQCVVQQDGAGRTIFDADPFAIQFGQSADLRTTEQRIGTVRDVDQQYGPEGSAFIRQPQCFIQRDCRDLETAAAKGMQHIAG